MKTKFNGRLFGSGIILLVTISLLSAITYRDNTALSAPAPFELFDPFSHSLQSTSSNIRNEVCNDGVDNNGNGLVDENCTFTNETLITKITNGTFLPPELQTCGTEGCKPVDNPGLANQANPNNGIPQPESEICSDGIDNDGNGLIDENCNSVNNPTEQDLVKGALPEQEICGDMQDNDGNGLVDENCGTSTLPVEKAVPQSNVSDNAPTEKKSDRFGIREIYPTKLNGEEWFIRTSHPEKDPRFSPQTGLAPNPDGSFKVKSTKVRMGVFTSSGYHPNLITTLDHSKIAARGYMQSANDWRDVEITGYIKLNSGSGDNFAWYARGGRHTGFGSPIGCEGVAYKGDLYYDGQTRWTKEQWHTGGYVFGDYQKGMGPLNGKWVGFRAIMYNVKEPDKTGVKLEIWLDKDNTGHWIKVNERVDAGGWGNNGKECGGTSDQIITWGGPIATFRWDSASDVDIRDFSVREIAST